MYYLLKKFIFFLHQVCQFDLFSVFSKAIDIYISEKEKWTPNLQKIGTGFRKVFHFFLGILSFIFNVHFSFFIDEEHSSSDKEQIEKNKDYFELVNKKIQNNKEKIQREIAEIEGYDRLLKLIDNWKKDVQLIK